MYEEGVNRRDIIVEGSGDVKGIEEGLEESWDETEVRKKVSAMHFQTHNIQYTVLSQDKSTWLITILSSAIPWPDPR